MKGITYLQVSDQKTSFTKCFSFLLRNARWIFKTGYGTIQSGNGIISPTSRPLIKKLLLQKASHFHKGIQNRFKRQEIELSKQEMEFLFPLLGL